jgi:hypothetical protein
MPVVLTCVLFMAACSSIDCPLNNIVYMKLSLDDGSGMLTDTLTISTVRSDGSDTVLVNRLVQAASAWVPVSYAQEADVLVLLRTDTLGNMTIDTLRVAKSNLPHFESVDCSPIYFHEISSLNSTHNGLDSAAISKHTIDYDTTQTHIKLYFKALH